MKGADLGSIRRLLHSIEHGAVLDDLTVTRPKKSVRKRKLGTPIRIQSHDSKIPEKNALSLVEANSIGANQDEIQQVYQELSGVHLPYATPSRSRSRSLTKSKDRLPRIYSNRSRRKQKIIAKHTRSTKKPKPSTLPPPKIHESSGTPKIDKSRETPQVRKKIVESKNSDSKKSEPKNKGPRTRESQRRRRSSPSPDAFKTPKPVNLTPIKRDVKTPEVQFRLLTLNDERAATAPPAARHNRMLFLGEEEAQHALESTRKDLSVTIHATKRATIRVHKCLDAAEQMLPLHFLKSQAASAQTEKAMTLIIDAIKFTINRDMIQGWRRWTVFVKRHRQESRFLSSIRIQTVWRMQQARKVLVRKVQVRDKQLRKAERKRQLEAQKLERLRLKSSTVVQKNFRGMQARQRFQYMVRRKAGATRMQSLVRTFFAKRILWAKQDLAARQERGAIALQQVFRGYEGRRRAQLVRLKRSREARDAQLADKAFVVTRFFQEQGATLLLQRWWHSVRKVRVPFEFKGHDAVIPLQALVRGYLVRKRTTEELARRRKFRLFKKHLTDLPERRVHMNATTVQNFYRTYLAKQIFRERREAHLQWQLEQQRLKASKLPKNKWWSGVKLTWRSISRSIYKSKSEVAMALRIQMWWRQTLARILLRTLKRHVYTEYSKSNYRSAVKIQALFRKQQSKKVFQDRKREVMAARIESVVRGHRGRKDARARSLVKHRAVSATMLQNWWRGIVKMRLARVALDIRRRHSLLMIRFQSVIRGWLATKRVEAIREQCRWEQERADCGLARYIYSIRRKKDNLLLLSAFGSISDDPEGPMQRVFAYWCSTRRVATSGAPRMSGVVFLKMIGSLPGIMNKAVDNNRLDIIFERAKRKGQKTLAYNEWVTALQYVGDTRLPDVVAHREARDDHARLLRLIDLCMASRWGSDIARDVHLQADNLIRRATVTVQRWRRNQDSYRIFKSILELYRVDKAAKDRYRAAVIIQYFWRRVTAKSETAIRALGVIQKFVDAKTELPYWYNPKTQFTSWTKPKLLGSKDVQKVISIAETKDTYRVMCSQCEQDIAAVWCQECDLCYCSRCHQDYHSISENKRAHKALEIDMCPDCELQMTTRICMDCGGDRFCETCFDKIHSKGELFEHKAMPLVPMCDSCGYRMARLQTQSGHSLCYNCQEQYGRAEEISYLPVQPILKAKSDMKYELYKSGGDADAVQVTPHSPYEEAAYRYAKAPGTESAEQYDEQYGAQYEDPNASYDGYDPNASYDGYDPNASYEGYEGADPNASYEGGDLNASYEGYENAEGSYEGGDWQTHYDEAGTPYYYNAATGETQWESPW